MKNRLPSGGRIDRNRPISFTFNGKPLSGYAGDTIASALLAANVRVVSRSFKYHRRRGVFGFGAEEPNAIFSVGEGAQATPNVRATLTPLAEGMRVRSQGGWPSVEYDIGAITGAFSRLLPAGFYYKTFMRPARLWMFYEKLIRRAASSAPTPTVEDESRYLHRHAHCDVLVAGGGAAGLSAALAAGRAGADVIIADMGTEFGGQILNEATEDINGAPAEEWLADAVAELRGRDNVRALTETTAQGYHDHNYVIASQNFSAAAGGARQRLWKIRARRVVVAAGAIERPLVFAGNDLPGVMLASAVGAYLHRFAVLPGRNILFFANNDSAYATAFRAADAGARVEIADLRGDDDGYWRTQAKKRKITVYSGAAVCAARDGGDFLAARLGNFRDAETAEIPFASHRYDVIAVAGGWTPTAHLFSQSGGGLRWSERLGALRPDEANPLNPCAAAGAANGAMSLAQCLREGDAAGLAAAAACGFDGFKPAAATAAPPPLEQPPIYPPLIPTIHPVGRGAQKHFVDLMNDVTAADILLAAREGYESAEHMKRYTAAGFGTDQGKTGNVNALAILAKARGVSPAEIGHTTYRPQYTPLSFGAVTGEDRGGAFAQRRTTPMDEWHQAHGAVYEDVGDWKRARHFPQNGESMDEAVWRECKAARNAVAAMDATTLGKIDVRGADAAAFLDMIYSNMMSTLAVGRCRYGLMLRETGMVFDDGVVARLGDNHFHLTTSTGHAAAVMTWMELWSQTEWPRLRVFFSSVTEQWAVISVSGPKARETLAEICDLPLAAADFPFMSFREGVVAGAPARVFRISFSGETAFEVNVPARFGLAVWEALFAAGEKRGIAPYGTESMHVLRAEKGFIIVGQDSDGTMTPHDMGLSWMVSKKKADFLGRRSLSRPDMTRAGRPQFTGLAAKDPLAVIPEGAQIVAVGEGARTAAPRGRAAAMLAEAARLGGGGGRRRGPTMKAQGHVTSSYMSPTLERSIALAMINDGFSRLGEEVDAVSMDGQRTTATIVDPVFFDKEGKRLHG